MYLSVLAESGLRFKLLQMQSGEQSSIHKVQDARQAAAFENPLRCRLLMACTAAERTLSQLHEELGAPLSKLHYHAERLIAAGLLTVSRSEKRPGRPIRHFRAVADRFLVPQAFLGQLPSEGWAVELRQALREANIRAGEHSLLYTGEPGGKMTVRLIRAEVDGPSRHIEIWRRLRLDPQQRAAFAEELTALFERYAKAEPGEAARPYLAHAAFAPRKPG